jgi:hypothetical protein
MPLDNKLIKLRAQAKKAGVPSYGSMSRAELQAALAGNGDEPKASKRKSGGSVKRETGVKVFSDDRPKRKPKRKQSVARKQAVTNPEAEMSERQAKRIVAKYAGKRGRRPAEFYVAQEILGDNPAPSKRKSVASAKPKAQSRRKASVTEPKASSNGNGDAGRNLIDKSAIDWKAEWAGGQSGNRGLIMKALRRFKGDYKKVIAHLRDNPGESKMYPKSSKTGKRYTKSEALAMLKWHVGRTAFDFVTATGQHDKATNRKGDKRTTGRKGYRPVSKPADNGSVADLSDRQLKNLVGKYAGKRGRKPARVNAAISELEKREKGKGRVQAKSSGSTRQARSQRRTGGRKRVKA